MMEYKNSGVSQYSRISIIAVHLTLYFCLLLIRNIPSFHAFPLWFRQFPNVFRGLVIELFAVVILHPVA